MGDSIFQFKINARIDYFVFFIIFIKIVFVIAAIGHLILSHTHNYDLKAILDPRFIYWKERTEFIFIASMSMLLLYYFRPGHEQSVNKETSLLFFIFGCILLFTANWGLFFKEAPWYKFIISSWSP